MAVASCRLTRSILRLLHRGGTTLPGRAALFFDRGILEVLSRDAEVIVVTGTNGKTTTCGMLRDALSAVGYDVLSNVSGANLLTGITAEFASNAALSGRLKKKYCVIECDEGALRHVVPLIRPRVIVVTNLFRDQLDRYGEVMHTLDAIRAGVKLVPDTTLCLNADCSLTSSLSRDVPNRVMYYGISVPSDNVDEDAPSDARYCINCGEKYDYTFHTYAHLGGFVCPKCGYMRHTPDVDVRAITGSGMSGTGVRLAFTPEYTDSYIASGLSEDGTMDATIGLPALYNVYNGIAALSAYLAAGYSSETLLTTIANAHSTFGRMETFEYNGVAMQMILVKNPAGCNQALTYITGVGTDYTAVFCLNDKIADGHDISWIWDAEYERLAADTHCKQIYVSGIRATDMQLRLKYAGVPESQITLMSDNASLIDAVSKSPYPVFMLPNYTSMLALRAELSALTGKREFWKEQK